MSIIFDRRHKDPIYIETAEGIRIKEHKDLLSIRTNVTDFVDFFSYCRYGHQYLIRLPGNVSKSYIKTYNELISQHRYGVESVNIHTIEKNRDNGRYITKEELNKILPDEQKDIIFRREMAYSRFLFKSKDGDREIILVGEPDRLSRENGNIIVVEDKPGNWHYYRDYPYSSYVLQAAIYAYSKFSLEIRPTINKVGENDNIDVNDITYQRKLDFVDAISDTKYDYDGNKKFFDMPHKKKILRINIRDPKFPEDIEDNLVITFDVDIDKYFSNYIINNFENFTNILSIIITKSGNGLLKCRHCRYVGYCPMMSLLSALRS